MIISAYQTVGKSTLVRSEKGSGLRVIDFESSCFDKSNPNWYIDYCKAAENLSKQGFIVFISSHQVVRHYLMENSTEKYVMIMYHPALKSDCLQKCRERYELDPSSKNERAMKNAELKFDDNVKEIEEDEKNGLDVIWLQDHYYKLYDIVWRLVSE